MRFNKCFPSRRPDSTEHEASARIEYPRRRDQRRRTRVEVHSNIKFVSWDPFSCDLCHIVKKPLPEVCRLCEQMEKPSSLTHGFHSACFAQVQQMNADVSSRSCSVCKHQLNVLMKGSTCPECGHGIARATCYFCKQPVFMNLAQEHRVWSPGQLGDVCSPKNFHPKCLELSLSRSRSKRVPGNGFCTSCRQWILKLTLYERIFQPFLKKDHETCEFRLYDDELSDKPEMVAKNYIESFRK